MSNPINIAVAGLDVPRADIVVIYVSEGATPSGAGAEIWRQTGLDFAGTAQSFGFKGRQGQSLDLPLPSGPAPRLLVLGAGRPEDTRTCWQDRGGSLMGKLITAQIASAAVVVDEPGAGAELIGALAAGARLRSYRFDRYRAPRKGDPEIRPTELTLCVADPQAASTAVTTSRAVSDGTLFARELIHEPPNVLGTVEFVDRLQSLAELGVAIEVLGEDELSQLGMRAMLAVAQGSARPPRLVVMRWTGNPDLDVAPLAIVGKGVVFDTGGISIKPGLNMEDMKADMSGAAAVSGLMQALAARKAKANVVGIVGLVENMPDGNATRPGDIVKAMSGTTIEIVNTDAEGRLVLADCLWYAQQTFKPSAVIDLATLTGAIKVALGSDHAGLFSNDDALALALTTAGQTVGEKLWRLPMTEHYDREIESRFADIKNSAGRFGASITAAQFLSRFIKDTPWAHLDIAGVAFGTKANETNAAWASGFGVALLDNLIATRYEG